MKIKLTLFALLLGIAQLLFSQDAALNKYRNRIGLIFGGGSGFDNVSVLQMSDGSKASLSFGGGYLVGFEFTHEFTKHLDMTLDAGGQFSELDRQVDNASMEFTRSDLALTPAYILSLGKTGRMRLKFGAGINWLYYPQLNFDLSKIQDGVKDMWKYKGAIGEHASIIFEFSTYKRFSFNCGLKIQNAKYSFKSGDKSYPISNDLKNPNGGGVEFLLGACYNFNLKKTND